MAPNAHRKPTASAQTVASILQALSNPSSVAKIRSGFGLSREKFGRLSGFSVRALANWEAGAQTPGEQARLRLAELGRLHEALARVMQAEAIPSWLDTPNPAFDGLKPLEVVERGQIDRLWRMLFYLEAGDAA